MSPTFKKLNLSSQTEIRVINAPASFEADVASLAGTTVLRTLARAKSLQFALVFVQRQAELDALSKAVVAIAGDDPVLWFAYPKKSSKNLKCEFDRDSGWGVLHAAGFDSVRMVAIDEDWSALRFRRVEHIRAAGRPASHGT